MGEEWEVGSGSALRKTKYLKVDELCLWSSFPSLFSPILYEPTAFVR